LVVLEAHVNVVHHDEVVAVLHTSLIGLAPRIELGDYHAIPGIQLCVARRGRGIGMSADSAALRAPAPGLRQLGSLGQRLGARGLTCLK